LILGTSTGEGNIRFVNSRAKFLCVVKMFIYVQFEQAERDVKRLQEHDLKGNIADFSAVAPAAAGAQTGAPERARRHREM
jgi:hypothetical protein